MPNAPLIQDGQRPDADFIARLSPAVSAAMPLAARIFDEFRKVSADGCGVTRQAFGAGEQAAMDVIGAEAAELGLEIAHDAAGNLYVTLPGPDRSRPAVLMGSHLDSVPVGGNYDGAAGVVAGVAVLAALRSLDIVPAQDIRVMGIRGEESVWFGTAYLGSGLALGLLPVERLDDLTRTDTGKTLAQHIDALGYDSGKLRADPPHLSSRNVAAYYELHIEQGPLLQERDLPVAVATVVRGNARYPFAHCEGTNAHSAAVPRAFRRDAVLATADLVMRLEEFWREIEAAGSVDSVLTVGEFYTDPEAHGMTTVPGRVTFTLNFGTTIASDIEEFHRRVAHYARDIEAQRDVKFELGPATGTPPRPLDTEIRAGLGEACRALGHEPFELATAGHDAAMFAKAGIPSGMVLVRNANGSHNPDEAMDMEDFEEGCRVLATALAVRGHL